MNWQKLIELVMALIAAIQNLFPKVDIDRLGGLIQLIRDLANLLPLPGLDDADECRAFLERALTLGRKWAGTNETALQLIAIVEKLVSDDNAWELVWGLFSRILNADPDTVMADQEIDAHAKTVGDELGIDPATIIAIITAAIQLIKFIRDWRNQQ